MPAREYTAVPAYRLIFRMSWFVYFACYLGRCNYAAVMVIIGRDQKFGLAQMGLVTTAFFITYGSGQLLSGVLGDRLRPQALMAAGLIGCGCSNLLMGFSRSLPVFELAWGINGLCCALIWPPLVSLLTQCMPPEKIRSAVLSFQYCTALGTCFTYVFASLVSHFMGWRAVFFFSAVILLAASSSWVAVFAKYPAGKKLMPASARQAAASESLCAGRNTAANFRRLYCDSGFILLLAVIFLVGFLKDGILTWVPQAVTDTYHINANLSVLLSAALPLLSIAGVIALKILSKRHGDIGISILLFCGAGLCVACLLPAGGGTPVLTVFLFAMADACVFGVNTVMTTMVPLRFAGYGRASTVAGITNAFTYLGSAFSGWGLGSLSGCFGWKAAYMTLAGMCGIGLLLCAAARPGWNRFAARKPVSSHPR